MLLGVHGSVGLHPHCQGWNMLWGEPHICAGLARCHEKGAFTCGGMPFNLKILLHWGEKGGKFLLIMIRMS